MTKNKRPAAPQGPSGNRPGGPTAAQRRLAAERAASARARIAQDQRRRQLFMIGGSVLAVIVVVAVLVIVKLATNSGTKSGAGTTPVAASVLSKVTSVPEATLNTVGAGSITTPPKPISGGAMTSGGKPEVLYIGGEFCPYCAAERWSLAVALSRFGTLHNVGQTKSSPSDVYPSTNTLSFHGSTFTSSTVAFTPREIYSNKAVGNHYASLDSLTADQQKIIDAQGGSIPTIDIGGKYVISGASYDPQVLHGKSWQQIADALADPNSSIAKAVDGTANVITAAICSTTNNAPASVCTSAGVKAAAAKLSTT